MARIPASTARAVVLRLFPRVLRAGLDNAVRYGALPRQLAADAGAIEPALGALVGTWLANPYTVPFLHGVPHRAGGVVSRCRDVLRGAGSRARPTEPGTILAGGLATLDTYCARTDDRTMRDIVDASLLLGASALVQPLASRVAAAAWNDLERLEEVAAALHQLALVTATAQGDREVDYVDLGLPDPFPADELDPRGVDTAVAAWRAALGRAFQDLKAEARTVAVGLSAISVGQTLDFLADDTLAAHARAIGQQAVQPLERHAAARSGKDAARRRLPQPPKPAKAVSEEPKGRDDAVRPGHVLVCPAGPATGTGKGRDVARGFEHAIGKALRLVPTPSLPAVRERLLAEFCQAGRAVDAILGELVGKEFVRLPPLVVVGPPGSGKSRFVRRLGEELGVGLLRVDATNDSGACFGGTERRWWSAEPCRAFMACARHAQANPLVLVDEVDKAPTRSEYGRIWDSMLQTLEPENAARFPDPCLQTDLDLSWVSFVCTANDAGKLPGPLLDRLRVVAFPAPGREHVEALSVALLADIARERGLDPAFLPPPDATELRALRHRWSGGSVRRLRRAVEAIVRVRDRELEGRPQ
jgi:ATP-dependent Lon protease